MARDTARRIVRSALGAGIIVATVIAVAYSMGAITGFLKGVDAYGHLTKTRLILDHFPNVDWNPFWDSGVPFFAWSYPPTFFLFSAFLVRLLGWSIEFSFGFLCLLGISITCLSFCGFIYGTTGNRFAALATPLVALSAPSFWNWWVAGGNYPRVFGAMFWGLSLYLASSHTAATGEGRRKRFLSLSLIVTLGLAMVSHLLVGAITAVSVFLYLFFTARSWRERFLDPLVVMILALCLAGFWVVPLIAARPGSRFWGGEGLPVPIDHLFTAPWQKDSALGFLLLPSILLFLLLWLLTKRRVVVRRGILLAIGLPSLAFLGYVGVGHLSFYPGDFYINGLPPPSAMFLVSAFLALLFGLLLGAWLEEGFSSGSKWAKGLPAAFMALTVIVILLELPVLRSDVRDMSQPDTAQSVSRSITQVDPQEKNYRFGTDSAFVSDWFSYFYDVPQTRDYFAQGVPYRDWQYWQEYTIWAEEDDIPTTNFLMDWYAIKWFLVGPPNSLRQKFEAEPQFYSLLSEGGDWSEFIYKEASPILTATRVPSLLLLSSSFNYETVVRDFSLVDSSSQHVIPVRGKEYIDDYALEELSQFDLVSLYGYKLRDQERALQLLADYVRDGGGLIVEANNSPFDNSPSVPEPIPVSRTVVANYGTEWHLTGVEHEILEGIDLSLIGPGTYDEGPWGVSSLDEADIRPWAQPVVFINDDPILVAGQYGEGRVVWTGMNLPYHILYYHNQEESRLLVQMIEWAAVKKTPGTPDYEAQFVNPHRRVVRVLSPAKGVLFKESFFPNWHAYVGGREVRIYRAGPDFMYVPLPSGVSYPLEVAFEYKRSLFEWASIGVSLATLVGLVVWAVKR